MSAPWRLGLALGIVLSVNACSTTPPARVASEPRATEPATTPPAEPSAHTPPAWLANFTLTSDVATAVYAELASREAMSGGEVVEWITRVAAALAQVPSSGNDEAEAQAWALTGLLIEEMASSARECDERPWTTGSDIESIARLLGDHPCPPFDEILHGLYTTCEARPFPTMAEFCRTRLQRWERAVGPACEPYVAQQVPSHGGGSENTDVLRFTEVNTLLHADEVDAVGEALARTLSERTGQSVRYESDSRFDYGSQCTAAYVPDPRNGDWVAGLGAYGETGFIGVSRSEGTDEWEAEVAAPHRPASWLRAARALQRPDPTNFGMGGIGITGGPPPRLEVNDSHNLPRSVDQTWRAITVVHELCNPWGAIEVVVSISARGELVRATPHKSWGRPFDVLGVRCLARGLTELTRPGRAVGRAVIELSPGPVSPPSDAFPLDSSPRVEACVGDMLVDLCLDVAPDGSVARWNAALAWESLPRALADVTAIPVTSDVAQCFASALEGGVACTQWGDQRVLDLPSRP